MSMDDMIGTSPRRSRLGGGRVSRLTLRENIEGWLFASPWILGFIIFTAGPMIASLLLSFTDWDILTSPQWIGLANYKKMFFDDPLALHSFRVTTLYALGSVPLRLALGLGIALLMNRAVRGINAFRTIYYLPSVLTGVAVALMWRWVFNSDFGLINTFLYRLFGIGGPAWLTSERWVLPALIIMSLWGVGGSMLIYLAGLQGIPTELYEASEVDGANAWHKFWHITIPMLSPIIFFNLVIGIISALQAFTNAFIITEGGPNNASLFTILYLYLNAFRWFKMGYASAIAWLLFLYILVLTVVVFRSSAMWVYYEGTLKGR